MDASLGSKVALDSRVVLQRLARMLPSCFRIEPIRSFASATLSGGKSGRHPGLTTLPPGSHSRGWSERVQLPCRVQLKDCWIITSCIHLGARQACIIFAPTCRSFGPPC